MKEKLFPTIVVLYFCWLFTGQLFAATHDVTLSLGNLCEYIGDIQTDDKGSTNTCAFQPYLASGLDYALFPSFTLSPELNLSFPQSGADENIKRMNIVFLMNTKYKTSFVNVVSGLGLFMTRIWGPGGEAELNNGTSTDSFPMPEEAVYTRNMILNLGLEKDFNQNWSGQLRTYLFNLTSSEDRAFSVGVQGTFHFGAVL